MIGADGRRSLVADAVDAPVQFAGRSATAVVYGVMVFVATLPGAAVLVGAWVRRA